MFKKPLLLNNQTYTLIEHDSNIFPFKLINDYTKQVYWVMIISETNYRIIDFYGKTLVRQISKKRLINDYVIDC